MEPVDVRSALEQLGKGVATQAEAEIHTAINFVQTGACDEAVNVITEVLKEEVTAGIRVFAHLLRAEAKIEIGAINDAIADLSTAIELDPYRTKAYQLRAKAYQMQGDSGRAAEDRLRAEGIGE